MDTSLDSLRRLLEKLKSIGLWDRLFRWGSIKSLLVDANGDLQRVLPSYDTLRQSAQKAESQLEIEKAESRNLRDALQQAKVDVGTLRETMKDYSALKEKNEQYYKRGLELRQEAEVKAAQVQELQNELSKHKALEEQRLKEFQQSVTKLDKVTEGQLKREEDERNERHRLDLERLRKQKETWSNHEERVKSRIKTICARHAIDYVDTVPFKGSPDNTLKIKDEFIVFDAKSPYGDDLGNFTSYLKNQVEQAIKYVKEEDVRKEVFLVVPTNTLEVIEQFEYKLADYTVYIISLDALEPIILALKKIEEYEFAEQLSPEERENICRVIGKFVHLSKRRIQIDGFFAKQFFELVYRSEADLPREMLDKVVEFEKSEKLNPPIEKRSKQISTKELEAETERLKGEANNKGILTQDSTLVRDLNKIPLYSVEPGKEKSKEQGDLFKEGA